MQKQRLREAFAYCEGLSFAEVARYIDKFPNRVTGLHASAVALSRKPECEIGGKSIEKQVEEAHVGEEAY